MIKKISKCEENSMPLICYDRQKEIIKRLATLNVRVKRLKKQRAKNNYK